AAEIDPLDVALGQMQFDVGDSLRGVVIDDYVAGLDGVEESRAVEPFNRLLQPPVIEILALVKRNHSPQIQVQSPAVADEIQLSDRESDPLVELDGDIGHNFIVDVRRGFEHDLRGKWQISQPAVKIAQPGQCGFQQTAVDHFALFDGELGARLFGDEYGAVEHGQFAEPVPRSFGDGNDQPDGNVARLSRGVGDVDESYLRLADRGVQVAAVGHVSHQARGVFLKALAREDVAPPESPQEHAHADASQLAAQLRA